MRLAGWMVARSDAEWALQRARFSAGGPAVVFFHGGGQTRHAWDQTAEQLAQRGCHCFTVDHKGHGESYWDPLAATADPARGEAWPYGTAAFAADLDALLAHLDLRDPAPQRQRTARGRETCFTGFTGDALRWK